MGAAWWGPCAPTNDLPRRSLTAQSTSKTLGFATETRSVAGATDRRGFSMLGGITGGCNVWQLGYLVGASVLWAWTETLAARRTFASQHSSYQSASQLAGKEALLVDFM